MVAQLVEWSLPTPEVRSSIPISDINIGQYSTNCNLEKTKIKKKEAEKGPFKKNLLIFENSAMTISFLSILRLDAGGTVAEWS